MHFVDVVVGLDAPAQQTGVVDALGACGHADLSCKLAKVVPARVARQRSVDAVKQALHVGLPGLLALVAVRRVQIVAGKVDERPVNAAPHIWSHVVLPNKPILPTG